MTVLPPDPMTTPIRTTFNGKVVTTVGAVINAISAGLGSDNYLGPCIIVTVAVGLTAALITTLLKVKETVGVDLNTITSSEYEK